MPCQDPIKFPFLWAQSTLRCSELNEPFHHLEYTQYFMPFQDAISLPFLWDSVRHGSALDTINIAADSALRHKGYLSDHVITSM